MNKYEYPDGEAAISVLEKLGTDISNIYLDQDCEYILADETQLNKYIELYQHSDTKNLEKRVLGCFIIQSITDLLPNNISENEVRLFLGILVKDYKIHTTEFEYWSIGEDENEEHWFHVTKYIREII